MLDEVKDKHLLLRTTRDAALALLACAGMVFYFLDLKKPVNFYERQLALTGKDATIDRSVLSPPAVWAADIFTMVIVLPALIIDLIFAFF
jgi:hypothetical protein